MYISNYVWILIVCYSAKLQIATVGIFTRSIEIERSHKISENSLNRSIDKEKYIVLLKIILFWYFVWSFYFNASRKNPNGGDLEFCTITNN
jgi:hypothetical protein